ncbi:MAG: hypothetical protein K6G73_12275 [Marinilabiliaceae bacterium]|nr:hypothetical protein [Marinilabiliaceae bacterium]
MAKMIYVVKSRFPHTDHDYWCGYKTLSNAKRAARSDAQSGYKVTVIKVGNPYETVGGWREFETRIIIGESRGNGKMRWRFENYEDTWFYDSVPMSVLEAIEKEL